MSEKCVKISRITRPFWGRCFDFHEEGHRVELEFVSVKRVKLGGDIAGPHELQDMIVFS